MAVEISIFPLHYFSLSLSLSYSLSQKLCILFIHSSHFTLPHSKAQEQEAPSKYHQTERETLQNSNSQIPISSHTTQHKSLLNCISACSVIHTIQDLQLELDGIESDGVGNYCF
ncbi:hypothetical protein ACB098_10G127600 [Castanea mollissima]